MITTDSLLNTVQYGAELAKSSLAEVIERLNSVSRSYENAVKGASKVTSSINTQLAELSRLRDIKQLSAEEEMAALQSIADRYSLTATQRLQLDSQVHETKLRQLNEELSLIEENAKRPQNSQDYMSKIDAYGELSQKYASDPQALAVISGELAQAEQARAAKISQMNADELSDFIKMQERKVAVAKRSDGLIRDGVEYQYDSGEQVRALDEMVRATESANAKLLQTQNNWTQTEQTIFAGNLANIRKYSEQREDLLIDMQKAAQHAEASAQQEARRIEQEALRAQEETQRQRLASAQGYIDAQIKLLKKAAQEKIDSYNSQIDEISRSLELENRADRDTGEQSKIDRLRELARYTNDDYSKMQLLRQAEERQAELDKAHAREAAEDKKTALRQGIEDVRDNLSKQEEALREYRESEALKSDMWMSGVVENTVKVLQNEFNVLSGSMGALIINLNNNAAGFTAAGENLGLSLFRGTGSVTPEQVKNWETLAVNSILGSEGSFFDVGKALGQSLLNGFSLLAEQLAAQVNAAAASVNSAVSSGGGPMRGSLPQAEAAQQPQTKEESKDAEKRPSIVINQILESVVPSPYEVAKATQNIVKEVLKIWA